MGWALQGVRFGCVDTRKSVWGRDCAGQWEHGVFVDGVGSSGSGQGRPAGDLAVRQGHVFLAGALLKPERHLV